MTPFEAVFKFSELVAGRYLTLMLDDAATISHDARNMPFRYQNLARSMQGRPAWDFFQLPKKKSLSQLFAEKGLPDRLSFLSRPEIGNLAEFGYTTRFPMATLQVMRVDENRYLGVVQFHHLFPDHALTHRFIEIYTDLNGIIKGYNVNLEAHLALPPERILEKPIREFLEGIDLSPVRDPARELEKEGRLRWKLHRSLDFGGGPELKGTARGRAWNAPPDGPLGLMALSESLDVQKMDWRIELSTEVREGFPPGILLMGDVSDLEFPDRHGYHFAVRPLSDSLGQLLIKRAGDILASRPLPLPALKGELRLTVRKVDRYFQFSAGGGARADFLDPDALDPAGTSPLVLSLMPGSRALLRGLKLYSSPRGGTAIDRLSEPVRFKGKPGALYQVQRSTTFYNEPLLVFTLVNVTDYFGLLKRYGQLTVEKERIENEARTAGEQGYFLGQSPGARRIIDSIPKVADVPMTIAIEGETGTGKEVLAHAVHRLSRRREMPFVKVDCAALPAALLESELFGHERGAFTGASDRRIGRFEQAQGGTLFLDEVSNLPLEVQAKLLDFFQTHEVVRLGGNERIRLNVKIIAAANRPLEELVRRGAFREDLYFRIHQLKIHLPPLRERREDISLLAGHFLRLANAFCNKDVKGISPEAMERLEHEPWPGNVRELKNAVFNAVAYSGGDHLTSADFASAPAAGPPPGRPGGRRPYKKLSRTAVDAALKDNDGNVSRAARALGVPRTTVYRILRRKSTN